MKINEKILSLPPYLSTSWANVKSLRVIEQGDLVVQLADGTSVKIPGLPQGILQSVFESHQRVLEGGMVLNSPPFIIGGPEGTVQHNIEMKDCPPLPEDMLQRIEAVSRAVGPEMRTDVPKPEPHCHCPYCQIAGAIRRGLGEEEVIEEEAVTPEELEFQEWKVEQTGDQLFNVINRIDGNEKYSVFLGSPVGCTCGKEGCDHILAVLRS